MENENKVEEKIEEIQEEKVVEQSFKEKVLSCVSKIKCCKGACSGQKCKKGGMFFAAIVLLLLIVGSYGFKYFRNNVDVGEKVVKEKMEKFLTENVPAGTKTEVNEITTEGSLYKVVVTVAGQETPVFMTRDGKKFIDPQGVRNLDPSEDAAAKQAAEPEQKEIPKTDKPTVDLYIMSFCPFGNKAEDTLKPAYDLLKNKVNFNFKYIVTANGNDIQSLHGVKEVMQNEREACVMKNYGKDQWMNFATYVNTNCGTDGACWEAGARKLKLNVAKINACVTTEGAELMKVDGKASEEAGAQGSPTMLINGVSTKAVYQYGNSEAYKQAICSAFNTAPAECEKVLSGATSTTEGGSCGN